MKLHSQERDFMIQVIPEHKKMLKLTPNSIETYNNFVFEYIFIYWALKYFYA